MGFKKGKPYVTITRNYAQETLVNIIGSNGKIMFSEIGDNESETRKRAIDKFKLFVETTSKQK